MARLATKKKLVVPIVALWHLARQMVNALMKLVRANIVLAAVNLLTQRVEILAFVQARINILATNHLLRILTEVPERPAEANIRLVLVKAGINGAAVLVFIVRAAEELTGFIMMYIVAIMK